MFCWHIYENGQNLGLHDIFSSFLEWTAKSKEAQVRSAHSNARSNRLETELQARIPERLNVRMAFILA